METAEERKRRKQREANKRWRGAHPEKAKQAVKECRIRRRDAYNETRRAHYAKNKERILDVQKNSDARRLGHYKQNARKRGHEWKLSDDEALVLFRNACVFCGVSPAKGIDRIDSADGYTTNNAQSCCKIHNMMKGTLSTAAFVKACKEVAEFCK
jgi:hypothetical protein